MLKTRRAALANLACRDDQFNVPRWATWRAALANLTCRIWKRPERNAASLHVEDWKKAFRTSKKCRDISLKESAVPFLLLQKKITSPFFICPLAFEL